MTTEKTLLTAEDIIMMPDDGYLYELLDGELLKMTPPGGEHGYVSAELQEKIEEWLNAGARLVWAMYPRTRSVVAYRSLTAVRVYRGVDILDGAPVLPDFTCPVAGLFPEPGPSRLDRERTDRQTLTSAKTQTSRTCRLEAACPFSRDRSMAGYESVDRAAAGSVGPVGQRRSW